MCAEGIEVSVDAAPFAIDVVEECPHRGCLGELEGHVRHALRIGVGVVAVTVPSRGVRHDVDTAGVVGDDGVSRRC